MFARMRSGLLLLFWEAPSRALLGSVGFTVITAEVALSLGSDAARFCITAANILGRAAKDF